MYRYVWLFEARSIGEFFKRLRILILAVIILGLYFFGATYLIESFIKAFNDNYLIITTSMFNNIVCLLLPAIILLIIYFRILNNVRRRDLVYRRRNKRSTIIYYFTFFNIMFCL